MKWVRSCTTFFASIFHDAERRWAEWQAEAEIIVGDGEFRIISSPYREETIRFRDISEIVAYKIDQIAVDLICCDIYTVTQEEGELVRTVDEEVPGFKILMKSFETLPGFHKDWWEAVVRPAFERNRTTLFKVDSLDITQ